MNRIRFFLLLAPLSLSFSTHAASYKFDNIDAQDMKNITREFSANFAHTTVSGASSLGEIFGFELGVMGATTQTPKLGELAQEVDANADANPSHNVAFLAQISVPMGITVEGTLFPRVGNDDFKFGSLGLAVKWTPTDTLLVDFPLSLAVRAHLTRTRVDMRQTVSGATTTLQYKNSEQGIALVASKNLGIVEPYVTFGYATATGELTGATVFNGDLAGSSSAEGKASGTNYGAGVELKLLIIRLGVEYNRLFDTDRFAGKLSFYF